MSDSYAEAIVRFEDEVDRACANAQNELTNREIADELRRMAQAWEDAA